MSSENNSSMFRQIVYLDFDGAETMYRNDMLDLSMSIDVSDSGLTDADRNFILSSLTEKYIEDGICFTATEPTGGDKYSTVYIGKSDSFDPENNFLGLAETIDVGNKIKNDNAYVFADRSWDVTHVLSVINHELDHIIGGVSHSVQNDTLDDFGLVFNKSGWLAKHTLDASRSDYQFVANDYVKFYSYKYSSASASGQSLVYKVSPIYYKITNIKAGDTFKVTVTNKCPSNYKSRYDIETFIFNSYTGAYDISNDRSNNDWREYTWTAARVNSTGSFTYTAESSDPFYVYVGILNTQSGSQPVNTEISIISQYKITIEKNPSPSTTPGGSTVTPAPEKPKYPDLYISNVYTKKSSTQTSEFSTDDTIAIHYVVKNQGSAYANPSTIQISVAGQTYTQDIAGVGMNASVYVSGKLEVAANLLGAGTHTISFKVNPNNSIAEESISNNSETLTVTVIDPHAISKPVLSGVPYFETDENCLTISWSPASGEIAGYNVMINGKIYSINPPILSEDPSFELYDLAEGDYTIKIRAYDTQGNYSDWTDDFIYSHEEYNFAAETAIAREQFILGKGQTSSGVSLQNGGNIIVSSGGRVEKAIINNGGTIKLNSDGIASHTIINSGGAIHVFSSGTTFNTRIERSGYLGIGDGAAALSNTIGYGGELTVWGGGRVYQNNIQDHGSILLKEGASAYSSLISSGGGLHVYSGAEATLTMVNQGGFFGVGDGALAERTTIGYGGELKVWAGGVTSDSIVEQYGALILLGGADAKKSVIHSNGGLHVYSGATASGTTVFRGGFFGVGDGATTYDTTIAYGGELTVWGGGTVHKNVIDPYGAIILLSGAVANSTTVKPQAGLHIYSGAHAYTTTITEGAAIGVGAGGTLFNSREEYRSYITLYEGSVLRGIHSFGGTVNVNGGVDADGATIRLEISARNSDDGCILTDIGNIYNASYTISAMSYNSGSYRLAGGFDNYSLRFSLQRDFVTDIGTIGVGETVNYLSKNYSLYTVGDILMLDISAASQSTAAACPVLPGTPESLLAGNSGTLV